MVSVSYYCIKLDLIVIHSRQFLFMPVELQFKYNVDCVRDLTSVFNHMFITTNIYFVPDTYRYVLISPCLKTNEKLP